MCIRDRCVLRWTQIIHFTDPSTGALTQITWLSQALYLLLLELIVVTFWLAARERKAGALVCFVQPRFGLFQAVGGGVLLISVLVGLAQVLLGKDQTAADLQTMAALLPYHMGIWVIRIVTYLLYLLGAVAGIVCVVEGIAVSYTHLSIAG